ncbi:FmdE family protein [Sulfurimonas hydrogeniphila]|uniref:FmdE family protein n=1 Tax=Sulfurimonas hydrogeniphila TaxID=2509341 RepID=UPI00125FBB4F|nr:FmdE family protein [Sulfurimonas hydrogeniphila]
MNYPQFFDAVQSIPLKDPLAQVLGAFENGEYEITYLEVVKAAGHSCPTVAGAYIMASEALKALYPNQRAVRGTIKVEFKESVEEGVAGVIGNVVSHITGATEKSGFKGLNGQFARHSLMFFNANIDASARFTRADTGKSVDVNYNPSTVPASPNMMPLMQKLTSGAASSEEIKHFGELWQERVKRIFENLEEVVEVTEL